jgi:hypothetical protein
MHYHLLAGYDPVNIIHEASYDDREESIDDFIGIIDNMFCDSMSGKEDRYEAARRNMRMVAEAEDFKVVFIGEPGGIHIYWMPCEEDKQIESAQIPIRN